MKTRLPLRQRGWTPIDPESFPSNLDTTPAGGLPILPYDAMNVLPTAAGYSSFFGKLLVCGEDIIPEYIFDMFSIQDSEGNIFQIGLADSGVYASYDGCDSPRYEITGNAFEEAVFS